jgi:hypothetical protein
MCSQHRHEIACGAHRPTEGPMPTLKISKMLVFAVALHGRMARPAMQIKSNRVFSAACSVHTRDQ